MQSQSGGRGAQEMQLDRLTRPHAAPCWIEHATHASVLALLLTRLVPTKVVPAACERTRRRHRPDVAVAQQLRAEDVFGLRIAELLSERCSLGEAGRLVVIPQDHRLERIWELARPRKVPDRSVQAVIQVGGLSMFQEKVSCPQIRETGGSCAARLTPPSNSFGPR